MRSLRNLVRITILLLIVIQLWQAHAADFDYRLSFIQSSSPVVEALGIDPLPDAKIMPFKEELRIWTRSGKGSIDSLYRFRIFDDENVLGQHFYYQSWLATGLTVEQEKSWSKQAEVSCVGPLTRQGKAVCEANGGEKRDWVAVHRALKTLGIYTLPDESELPDSSILVQDGSCILVEASVWKQYRIFRYCNPKYRDEQEARRAHKIMELLGAYSWQK